MRKRHLYLLSMIILSALVFATTITITSTQSHFDSGTYENTEYNSTNLILNTSEGIPFDDNQEEGTYNMSHNQVLWHMDETTSGQADGGADINESSGNGYHANLTTGNYNLSQDSFPLLGTSIFFDGSSSYSAGDVEMSGWANLTVSSWFKTSDSSSTMRLVSKDEQGSNGNFVTSLIGGNAQCNGFFGGNNKFVQVAANYYDNEWHQLVCVIDEEQDRLILFFDGEHMGNTSWTHSSLDDGDNYELYIGSDSDVGAETHFFNGYIDEVAIWNRSLSEQEILNNYNLQNFNVAENGNYTSEVFDLNTTHEFLSFQVNSTQCYNCELPTNDTSDTDNFENQFNMSNIQVYLKMNEGSDNTVYDGSDVEDFSGNENHFNFSGSESWTGSGKFNDSVTFDGSAGQVTTAGDIEMQDWEDITISTWFKTANTGIRRIVSKDQVGLTGSFILLHNTGDVFQFFVNNGGSFIDVSTSSTGYIDSEWHHLVGKTNNADNTIELFLDGVSKGTTAWTQNGLVDTANEELVIGADSDVASPSHLWVGKIDEVAIWNRSLSTSEIEQLYRRGVGANYYFRSCNDAECSGESFEVLYPNQTADLSAFTNNRYMQFRVEMEKGGLTYSPIIDSVELTTNQIIVDSENPSIEFIAPLTANDTYLDINTITLNVSATDDVAIETIILELYNSTGLHSDKTSTTSPFSFQYETLPDGVYTYNATVNDTTGNRNSTETYTFTIDTTLPFLLFEDPTPANDSTIVTNNLTFNITATDTNLNQTQFTLFDNLMALINSTISGDNLFNIDFTELANGLYFFNATSTDLAGNTNTTGLNNFTIDVPIPDTLAPDIQFVDDTPKNSSLISFNDVVGNVTSLAGDIDTITMYLHNTTDLYQTNTSTTSPLDVLFGALPDGNYTLNATINDTSGNINSTTQRLFQVDTTPPQISLTYPTSQNYTDNVTNFNYTITELNLDSCWYSPDLGVTNITIAGCTSPTSFDDTIEGQNTLSLYANDSANNLGSFTVYYNYTLLQFAPSTITNLEAIDITNSSILWNWTNPTEPDFNQTIIFLDGSNIINLSSATTQYNATGLSPFTSHTVDIQTVSTAELINTTNVSDTQTTLQFAPTVTLTSPTDASSVENATQTFNASFTDDILLVNSTLEIYNSTGNTINETTVLISGLTNSTSINFTFPEEGTYKWNYLVFDSNKNFTYASENFTITYSLPTEPSPESAGGGSDGLTFTSCPSGQEYINGECIIIAETLEYTEEGIKSNVLNFIEDKSPKASNAITEVTDFANEVYQEITSKDISQLAIAGIIFLLIIGSIWYVASSDE